MRLKCQNYFATSCTIYYPKVPKRIIRSSKVKKLEILSSHFFDPSKKQPDHLRHNVTFGSFSELNSLSCFWTFLKMSKFHFPFGFLEILWHWKNAKEKHMFYQTIYGQTIFDRKKCTFWRLILLVPNLYLCNPWSQSKLSIIYFTYWVW